MGVLILNSSLYLNHSYHYLELIGLYGVSRNLTFAYARDRLDLTRKYIPFVLEFVSKEEKMTHKIHEEFKIS